MISTFKTHMEILPPEQQRLWPALRPAPTLGLVLYGGTAIALRLGHRSSVDFDFFTDRPLDKDALRDAFPFLTEATILQERPETLTVLVPGGEEKDNPVKMSFFGGIHHGRIGVPESTEDGVLVVASLIDLLATKVKVVLQRIEAKDYLDIAAMLRTGGSLAYGLAAARTLYGREFQTSESLKALVYFEGGDLHTLPETDKITLLTSVSEVRDLPQAERVASGLGLE